MGTSQKSMVQRCLLACLLLVLDIFTVIQASQNGNQDSWFSTLFSGQSAGKRNIKDDAFWAARGKRSDPAQDAEFYALRGKRQFIKPNGFFQAFPSTDKGMKRTKAFRETSEKRTMKPNGLFGTFKRSFKPNSLFVIPSKRGLKPNGLFVSMKRSLKPNGLFVMGKRGMLKPNGLFGTIKRGLKPNGLFGLQKRGLKPNGLFGLHKRGLKPNGLFGSIKRGLSLKPNGLFALSKRAPIDNTPDTWTEQGYPYGIFKGYNRYYQGVEDTQENEEDENLPLEYYLEGDEEDYANFEDEIEEENDGEIMEVKRDDSDFWAARGKRSTGFQEADFWATRGKRSKDPDFWAVRGKKSINEEETENISDEVPEVP